MLFLYPKKGTPPKKLVGYVSDKNGWIVECVLKGNDLRRWAAEKAGSLGMTLPAKASDYLSYLCGCSAASMLQEIEKVAVYLDQERTITVDSLQAVGCRSGESSVFDLVDAVAGRRLLDVAEKLADLLEQGQAPYAILFMVARYYLQLLEAVLLREEGRARNAGDLAGDLGLHPYPAGKLWSQSGATSPASVMGILRSLLDADMAMKTGRGDAALLLESALAETVNS